LSSRRRSPENPEGVGRRRGADRTGAEGRRRRKAHRHCQRRRWQPDRLDSNACKIELFHSNQENPIMKYMLLMYADETKAPQNNDEIQAAYPAWSTLGKELETAGVLIT